tara:strand:+ start:737 stop:1654 length:918 start_codon:yes stop_codon:yes gene_type:complete
MPKHCLIIGSGAIGSFYGYKLSKSATIISVLARSNYEHIKKNGIIIRLPDQTEETFTPNYVLKQGDLAPSVQYDYILICTKVLPSVDFKTLIQPYLTAKTTLVLIQNGINIEAFFQKVFPQHELISGLAFICVSRLAPGLVHHQDYGKLTLGHFPSGSSQSCKDLVKLFCDGGTDCHLAEDIAKERFIKLLWNAPFNPLSVLNGGATTQTLLASKDIEIHVRSIMKEVLILADAEGYSISTTLIDSMIENTKKMTPYKTSMLLDYEQGLELETEAILGNSLAIAKKHSLKVPFLERLYNDLNKIN